MSHSAKSECSLPDSCADRIHGREETPVEAVVIGLRALRRSPNGVSRVRRRVLLAHAVITAAAGLVLIVRPKAIPAAVGIPLTPDAFLLSYLLAAAEWGFAVLSWLGARMQDSAGLRAVMLACVTLHLVSGVLESAVWIHSPDSSPILLANIAARLVIVAGLVWLLPRSPA